jgi:hypothetical protein
LEDPNQEVREHVFLRPLQLKQIILKRGMHDIEHQIIYPSNPGFVFHDSRGFESGAVEEVEAVHKFIKERASEPELKDRLHAIW